MENSPVDLIRPGRTITGMSAILLPFDSGNTIDWNAFESHLLRTIGAGLIPAVNMDTGYTGLLDEKTKSDVLRRSGTICGDGAFVAGAFVKDSHGAPFDPDAYKRAIGDIEKNGGIPVIMQSYGLTGQPDSSIVSSYHTLASQCDRCILFELGTMFAPFGKVYDLSIYEELMMIPSVTGAKHSSLSRQLEWDRIRLRDKKRPGFRVYTGNDLAIDMVMYGSDYLLGLSTFAPDVFAYRDRLWEKGDSSFYEVNDALQFLGHFTFRDPVPAYKHNAAQFLKLQGWIGSDRVCPGAPERPESDTAVLRTILEKINEIRAKI